MLVKLVLDLQYLFITLYRWLKRFMKDILDTFDDHCGERPIRGNW